MYMLYFLFEQIYTYCEKGINQESICIPLSWKTISAFNWIRGNPFSSADPYHYNDAYNKRRKTRNRPPAWSNVTGLVFYIGWSGCFMSSWAVQTTYDVNVCAQTHPTLYSADTRMSHRSSHDTPSVLHHINHLFHRPSYRELDRFESPHINRRTHALTIKPRRWFRLNGIAAP